MFHTFLKLLHGISQIKSSQSYYVSFCMFLCIPMLLQSHGYILNKLWNIVEKIFHLCDIGLKPLHKIWNSIFSCHIINLVYIGLNSLPDHISHILPHRPSKVTELTVTKSGNIHIVVRAETTKNRNMWPTLPSFVMPLCAVDNSRVMGAKQFQIVHSTRVRF